MIWMKISPLAGFVYLVILISTRIVLLRKSEVQVISGTDKTTNRKVLIYFVFVLMVLLWLFELLRNIFQLQIDILPLFLTKLYVESILLKIAGNSIIVLSLVLITVTLIHFGNSLRFGLNDNNRGELITGGIFAVTRNPFFLSIDLYFLGTAILLPTAFFFIYAGQATISIHFFILKEEKFMQKIYGEQYKKYFDKVGRYFDLRII